MKQEENQKVQPILTKNRNRKKNQNIHRVKHVKRQTTPRINAILGQMPLTNHNPEIRKTMPKHPQTETTKTTLTVTTLMRKRT